MYNLKKTYANDNIGWAILFIILGIFFIWVLVFQIFFLESDYYLLFGRTIWDKVRDNLNGYLITFVIGIFAIYLGICFLLKYIKIKQMYKMLAKHGTLVKNHPYYVRCSGAWGLRSFYLIVDFNLPDGSIKKMQRNYLEFKKRDRKNEGIDVLYDPSNPNNYYLQFNIEETDDEVKDL